MSKIRVYVRVRPSLPRDFDAPGSFDCTELEDVSGNWIRIIKDGEPKRYFSRVWGPRSQQEEVFRTIGVNTVSDVMEGYDGCIFVYGQTGTGKTFSLGCTTPGLEGIQPRCLQLLFEKIANDEGKCEYTVKQQYVQLYRNKVQDLMNIANNDLNVRVGKTGATIEGVTTRVVRSYAESLNLIRQGDGNRSVANTEMNSESSRSHACLITEVYRRAIATGVETRGRLYLIDLAGSERVNKSGVTGENQDEAIAINQSLTTLGNCIAGLVAGEKVIAFRESTLTRLLQHSLQGNGRTSILVTLRPDSPNMQETITTLKFGDRAQKVESQMTPASYRDQLASLSDAVADHERGISDAFGTHRVNAAWVYGLSEKLHLANEDLRMAEEAIRAEEAELRFDTDRAKEALRLEFEKELRRSDEEHLAALDALTQANKSILDQIADEVATAALQLEMKHKKETEALQAEATRLRAESSSLQIMLEEAENPDDCLKNLHVNVAEKKAELRESVATSTRRLKGCRRSKHEGLSLHELLERSEQAQLVRAKLGLRAEKLNREATGWDTGLMVQAFTNPDPSAVEDYWVALRDEPHQDDDELEPPPPPPEDSDDSSWDSSVRSSRTRSGSSSAPTSTSSTSPLTPPTSDSDSDSDVEAATRVDRAELELQGNVKKKVKPLGVAKEPIPRSHFERALRRDAQLSELLEQIVEYLEYGCRCYHVDSTVDPPVIVPLHIFLSKGKQQRSICIAQLKEGTSQPDRSTAREVTRMSQVSDIVLGQFSKAFLHLLEEAPKIPPGTVMPPTSAKLTGNSLAIFFYRSMTLYRDDGSAVLDVVFDSDTDFEAWMVTLHRLTLKDPRWGGPLDIATVKDFNRLTDDEKAFCTDFHILPSCLLQAKHAVLHREPRVFYTLFDMRAVSNLDLLHAQKVLEILLRQNVFSRVHAYQVRYPEVLEAEKRAFAADKQRIRIALLCKCHSSENWVSTLRTVLENSNDEDYQTVLDQLTDRFGPEPDFSEIPADDVREVEKVLRSIKGVDEVRHSV